MNVNSIQNINTNSKASFKGNDFDDEKNYRQLVDTALELRDTYEPKLNKKHKKQDSENQNPDRKNILAIGLSLGLAAFVTYAGGKLVAKKAVELFPKPTNFLSKQLEKASNIKAFDKASGFFEKHADKIASKEGKANQLTKAIRTGRATVSNYTAKGIKGIQNGLKSEDAIAKTVGVAAATAGVSKVATVDGDHDGVKDIAQKSVNAYESAIKDLGSIASVIKIIS